METHRKEFTYWLLVDILGYLDISPIRVSGLEVSLCTKTFIAGSCLHCVHVGTTPGTTLFFYLQAVLTQRQRPTQNCRVVDHKSLFILRNVVNPHPGTLSFIVV